MDRKPPFDPLKAAFWLVAFVVGVHSIVVLGFTAACLMYAEQIIVTSTDCDPNSRLTGLLAAVLAAALAFVGLNRK